MDNKNLKIEELISTGIDYLNITISKEEVVRKDFTGPMNLLGQLTSNITFIKYFRERVDISFDGYNQTAEELWEIPEVRDYVVELDSQFPYWLYFLSKNGGGLFVIIKCFLLPFLMPEAEKEINGKRLQNYLEQRGFLAMNHLCELANLSEEENIQMTNRVFTYFQ
ncbi:MAG: chlororespiratory reduction 6 domain-containing protein [Lentimicrobium sp.]|nr:chlororespiratory reduction 6 domain-containing protein [Lentimicrobium sp.]